MQNPVGAIRQCDAIARGIVQATVELHSQIPLGSLVKDGKEIMNKSGMNLTIAGDLADAADEVVSLWQKELDGFIRIIDCLFVL